MDDKFSLQPSAFNVELVDIASPYTLVRALMARVPTPLADVLQRCAQPTAWPINLPLLTCQAVGGDPRQAVVVAAAFELARLAARVLDDVEDLDRDDALWCQVGMPQAINAGSTLLACAYLALSDLEALGADPELIVALQQDFAHVALTMAAAQHRDLTTWEELLSAQPILPASVPFDLSACPAQAGRLRTSDSVGDDGHDERRTADPGCGVDALDWYWEIAAGKSGVFFALGCRAGARLAASPSAAQPYSDFGYHLGLLLQAFNDGRGFPSVGSGGASEPAPSPVLSPSERRPEAPPEAPPTPVEGFIEGGLPRGHRLGEGGVQDLGRRLTLPVAYTLAVCPEARQPLLEALDSGASDQAVAIMTHVGAVHYLLTVAESHRTEAIAALERAPGDPVAHQTLLDLLPEILPVSEVK